MPQMRAPSAGIIIGCKNTKFYYKQQQCRIKLCNFDRFCSFFAFHSIFQLSAIPVSEENPHTEALSVINIMQPAINAISANGRL